MFCFCKIIEFLAELDQRNHMCIGIGTHSRDIPYMTL